jgi:hypothetical protein
MRAGCKAAPGDATKDSNLTAAGHPDEKSVTTVS